MNERKERVLRISKRLLGEKVVFLGVVVVSFFVLLMNYATSLGSQNKSWNDIHNFRVWKE